MLHRMKRRLRSRNGESIAETLIAVMIAALALALLAGMIATGTRLVKRSRESTALYAAAQNTLAEQSGGESGTVKVSMKLSDSYPGSIEQADDGSFDVSYYAATVAGKTVVSYKVK